MRTHPFTSTRGRSLRVVEDDTAGAEFPHYLETSDGFYIGPCNHTGPEILKLSEQGRALWGALWQLLDTVDRRALNPPEKLALDMAKSVLDRTAATFDHNEPEESEEPAPLCVCGHRQDRHLGGACAFPGCSCLAYDGGVEAAFNESPKKTHNPARPIPLVPEVDRAED